MYKLRCYRLMQIISRKCNSTTDNIIRTAIIVLGNRNSTHCYVYNTYRTCVRVSYSRSDEYMILLRNLTRIRIRYNNYYVFLHIIVYYIGLIDIRLRLGYNSYYNALLHDIILGLSI